MKRSHFIEIAMITLISLSSLATVGGSFFLKTAFNNNSESQLITDISQYQQIRQKLSSHNEHIQHFPHKLPADAENIHLAYYSGNATTASFFQVRFKYSPETIQKLLRQYQHLAQYHYRGGNTNDHVNQKNGVPTTFFYTSDAGMESFPPSYEILVLDAQDQGKPGFKWNHGYSYGVAIDSSAAEIVYWAEKW
jgi:hypothetical protein